ncbi:hypothetical protein [Burkholderia cepacia]|uniref:hypothetical protein n=1 Tax=Burkholderia cepacia TaxID=292 RepID=UPI000B205E6F|nr:hypothetical protein [Burkholderia cepacia]
MLGAEQVLSAQQIDPSLDADEMLAGTALPNLEQARIALTCVARGRCGARVPRARETAKPSGDARLKAWRDD